MRQLWQGLGLGLALLGAGLAHAERVEVLITHEAQEVGKDGVTRSSRYEERMVRDTDNVWLERVLPAAARAHEAATGPDHEHEHVDMALAGRHITVAAQGRARLALVLKDDKLVVDLLPTDYGTVGFRDCWACAYHYMDPAELKAMKLLRREGGKVWYEKQNGERIQRIQWDEALALPLSLETRLKDGSGWSRVTIRPAKSGNKIAPWTQYAGFTHRDLSDFGD